MTLMAVLLYQTTGILYQALTLQLFRMTPAATTEVTTVPAAAVAVRETLDTYQPIIDRNIFGTQTKSIEEKQAENKPAPQPDITILFDLRGTVAGDERTGFAVIEEKSSKKQKLVKIGDVVSGAKVVRIKRNSIDVLVNDQTRTLKLAERAEAPIVPPPVAGKTAAAPAVAGAITVNRSEISSALTNMGTLLRQAQIRPYFKGGVPDGFMITNIEPGSIYQRMGINNGDILKGVDGRNIQTADDMTSFLNTLQRASGVAVTIQRGGRPQTLNYQFR